METAIDQKEKTLQAIRKHKLALSVDCVIFGYGEDGLKILLLECNLPRYQGQWTLLGDFVFAEEPLDQAASRVLKHYTGLSDIYLEQVATFGDPNRHPLGRVVTTAYYSLLKMEEYTGGFNGLAVQWFPIKNAPNLAFDHGEILRLCHERMQRAIREHPIGFNLLPRRFTLSQLQTLYEVVLEIELDKRNFRRKLQNLHLLVSTGETQTDVSHRPAALYKFDFERYNIMRSSGFNFEI